MVKKSGISRVACGTTGEVVNVAQRQIFSPKGKIGPVPDGAMRRSLQQVFCELLESEINAGLQTFAFDIVRVWIGDELNGIEAQAELTPLQSGMGGRRNHCPLASRDCGEALSAKRLQQEILVGISVVVTVALCPMRTEALSRQGGASLTEVRPVAAPPNVPIFNPAVDTEAQLPAVHISEFCGRERATGPGMEAHDAARWQHGLAGFASGWSGELEFLRQRPWAQVNPTYPRDIVRERLAQVFHVYFDFNGLRRGRFLNDGKFLSRIKVTEGRHVAAIEQDTHSPPRPIFHLLWRTPGHP